MNILILSLYSPTGSNFPEGIGGSQEVILQLGKRWANKGHCVKIISTYKDEKIPKKEVLDEIEIERVGNFYNSIFKIRNTYKKYENWADIVLENYTSYPLYAPLYVKKPLITIMHHLIEIKYIKTVGLINGIISYLSNRTIPFFYNKFIAVSEFTKNQILTLEIPNVKIEVIPNGIDIDFYVPAEKESYPLIFFIGNFSDGRKRVEDLLDAFKKKALKIPDAKLVIAGNGGSKELEIQRAARNNNNIEYLGSIDTKTKKGYYQRAWIFVNPSIAEGFSLSCLEANACGTPAVVYNLKGLETVQHRLNGLIVEQRNVDELAKAITDLLINQELRKEMSIRARKFAEGFNWDTSAENVPDRI